MYVASQSTVCEWHQFQGLNEVIYSPYRQIFRACGGLRGNLITPSRTRPPVGARLLVPTHWHDHAARAPRHRARCGATGGGGCAPRPSSSSWSSVPVPLATGCRGSAGVVGCRMSVIDWLLYSDLGAASCSVLVCFKTQLRLATPHETVQVWRYKAAPNHLLDFACAFSASATRAAFSRSASLRDPK